MIRKLDEIKFKKGMPFVACNGSITGNIDQDCSNPRISGYEDFALIFNRADIDWSAVTVDANNPRIITAIAMATGKTPYAIYNPKTNPARFDGTNTTYSQDDDRYTKTLQFYFEGIGGDAAADIVEPLKSGDYIVILQRKDHRGDGSFQVLGYQSGLVATAQVQDETTGRWTITMESSEPSAEISFFVTDYATTKAAFDVLKALVP